MPPGGGIRCASRGNGGGGWISPRSAEGVAAAAGLLGVGVVDGEPGALQPVAVVEGGAGEQLGAGGVDHDLHTRVVGDEVVAVLVGVEEHLVAEA